MTFFSCLVSGIFVGILIIFLNGNLVNAQSSNITATGCEKGIVKGLICVNVIPTYKLVRGEWDLYADGVNGILNISSVDDGEINGTLVGGGFLCTKSDPCIVNGSFDQSSGKVSFISTPTIETLAAVFENFTGYLSSQVQLDFVNYNIVGTGKEMGPGSSHDHEFGWYASKGCLVLGCL